MTVIALVAAIVYLLFVTPVYTASAVLMLDSNRPQVAGDPPIAQFLADQREAVRSPKVLEAALNVQGIRTMKALGGAGNAARLREIVSVHVDPRSSVVAIEANAADPTEAASIVDAVTQAYLKFQNDQQSGAADKLVELSTEREKRSGLAHGEGSGGAADPARSRRTRRRFKSDCQATAAAQGHAHRRDRGGGGHGRDGGISEETRARRIRRFTSWLRSIAPARFSPAWIDNGRKWRPSWPNWKCRALKQKGVMFPEHPVVVSTQPRIAQLKTRLLEHEKHYASVLVQALEQEHARPTRNATT